jgi:hypothetical protein
VARDGAVSDSDTNELPKVVPAEPSRRRVWVMTFSASTVWKTITLEPGLPGNLRQDNPSPTATGSV